MVAEFTKQTAVSEPREGGGLRTLIKREYSIPASEIEELLRPLFPDLHPEATLAIASRMFRGEWWFRWDRSTLEAGLDFRGSTHQWIEFCRFAQRRDCGARAVPAPSSLPAPSCLPLYAAPCRDLHSRERNYPFFLRLRPRCMIGDLGILSWS